MTSTREHILQATAKALTKKPDSSLSALAQAIGIGRTTLHRYFPKREDLIAALTLYSLQLVDEAMRPIEQGNLTPLDALYEVLNVLIPMGEHFHFLLREYTVLENEDLSRKYDQLLEPLSELIQTLQAEGAIAADMPTAWIVRVVEGLVYTAWEAVEAGDVARNNATNLVFRTLMNGFKA